MTRRAAIRRCAEQLPRDFFEVALEPCDDAFHFAVRDALQAHVRDAWRSATRWAPDDLDG